MPKKNHSVTTKEEINTKEKIYFFPEKNKTVKAVSLEEAKTKLK